MAKLIQFKLVGSLVTLYPPPPSTQTDRQTPVHTCICVYTLILISLTTHLLEQSKQYVSVDGPLVSFVQHDDRVLLQVSVDEALS